jgi:hypothetical protein
MFHTFISIMKKIKYKREILGKYANYSVIPIINEYFL